jgi:hypothetical protein
LQQINHGSDDSFLGFGDQLLLVTRGANVHGKKSGNLAALIILPEASLE